MTQPFIETRRSHLPNQETEEGRRGFIQATLIRIGLPPVKDWQIKGAPILARIEHGRWIADCECRGAEFVDPEWPVFVCCSCGAGPRPVAFPGDRHQIESELMKRPVRPNRNWNPGETVADLRRENKERGII